MCWLAQLLNRVPDRLPVARDGLLSHHGRSGRGSLAAGVAQRPWLKQLPGYASELSLVKRNWGYPKHMELGNLVCHRLKHLRPRLDKAVARLKQMPLGHL